MSGGSDIQFPALSWSTAACTCGAHAPCTCATRQDALALVRGEVTAYFLAHRQSVCRYLVHRGCGSTEAEDITQEAFLRLYRIRVDGQTLDEDSVLPWLLKVGRRLAIDGFRHRQVEQSVCAELSRNLADTLPDTGQTCEDDLLERQRRAMLMEAIQRLSTIDRECLHLRAQGHSLKEIADIVGLTVSGVSYAVSRAIRRVEVFVR